MNTTQHTGRRALACLLAACTLAILPFASPAKPAGAEGDNFIYQVEAGDTLLALAERYTGKSANWQALQSLNHIGDPTRLPIALELKIPFSLIPEDPSQARVSHVSGEARLDGEPLRQGDLASEGNVIRTGARGYVTLALSDGSKISVPANSTLHLKRLRVFRGTGLTDSIFSMQDGGLESEVSPEDTGVGRFEVQTPVSITGVRGTRLRVRVASDGSQSEVIQGRARLNTSQAGRAMLRAGQGAATSASGELLGVRQLLPAPQVSDPKRGGGGWQAHITPMPGAVAYLVRVAGDSQGTQLYSSQRVQGPDISFSAPGTGHYYARVRAIDANGIMGEDAVLPFEGLAALRTSFGLTVATGFQTPVLLGY